MPPDPKSTSDSLPDRPGLEQNDRDNTGSGELVPESLPENGDFRYDEDDPDGELPEEDDDNPYQESDDALPDDTEERAIARDVTREGGRLDEP